MGVPVHGRSPRHVQTCSTWTSLYRTPAHPWISSNLLNMNLIGQDLTLRGPAPPPYKAPTHPLLHSPDPIPPFCTAFCSPSPPPTCSNLINLDFTVQGPNPPQHVFKLVHYEERTVRKRAVGIRLECLLVMLEDRLDIYQAPK